MILDIRDKLDDRRSRMRNRVEGIMVHRCGVNLRDKITIGYDGLTIGKAFIGKSPQWEEVAKATGHENAYTCYIGGNLGPPEFDGVIWQALALDDIGAHARRFSARFIGLGLIADPRVQPVSESQRWSLIELMAMICPAFDLDPYRHIRGHGEVKDSHDGSKAPGKINACPGDTLNMNLVRDDVALLIQDKNKRRLHDAGLVYTRNLQK